ncbi:hypothetical protein L1987_33401 [Smallanthus sonchifolius]|uniref:Uncharacterized protein n=1 Tax=Smallanthus sonchifolius TaxID=185202 RepID=A0ACB9HTI6_9ASTR|nr:hypothetical protein L1987_33401 [Smallanthus sonchifolius]
MNLKLPPDAKYDDFIVVSHNQTKGDSHPMEDVNKNDHLENATSVPLVDRSFVFGAQRHHGAPLSNKKSLAHVGPSITDDPTTNIDVSSNCNEIGLHVPPPMTHTDSPYLLNQSSTLQVETNATMILGECVGLNMTECSDVVRLAIIGEGDNISQ